MHSDTLADMLIRLKNAAAVKKATVTVPATKMNFAVLNLLLKENYIASFEKDENSKFPTLIVKLKYVGGSSALAHVKKISKPGVRIYSKATELKRTLSGYGIKVVSTSHGLMTDADARKNKLGGEVLAELW
ncbi:MAG: 30S ribosomal protein S8 [Candidatus Moraniibacteriota bacterium]|nr:MAG: 30S ribosomal protein S8 [Candidatus Moranbacteria bacterium]